MDPPEPPDEGMENPSPVLTPVPGPADQWSDEEEGQLPPHVPEGGDAAAGTATPGASAHAPRTPGADGPAEGAPTPPPAETADADMSSPHTPGARGPERVEADPAPMDEDGRAQSGTKRGLPRDPRVRAPYRWRLVPQRGKGKPAACRRCVATFEQGEARLTLESDFRANASRYYHVCCVPGGFHPCDAIEGLHDASPAVQQEIRALRAEDAGADEDDITLPLARCPRTVEEAGARAPDWWGSMSWDNARHLRCGTLIDVPRAVRAAFADLKLDLVAAVEETRGDSVPNEVAWMRLSFIDALVLNSSRSPGESQAQSVARRIMQARDGEWPALWREATEGRDRAGVSASRTPKEAEAALAARIEDLAHAGQARRAARAVALTKPAITDKGRLDELKALFPSAPVRADGPAEQPCVESPPSDGYWTGVDGAARRALMKAHVVRSIRRPARRTAPGPMGSRPEHWEVLTATHDGVERFASLVVDLALGQVPRGVVRGHSRGEVIAIGKDKGGMRPLVTHSILRRMGLAAVTRVTQAQAKVAAGVHQLGIGTPDGCAKAYHALGSLSRTAPGRVILALDVEAAHQSLDRAFMRAEVHDLCPVLDVPLAVWYPSDEDTIHWWRTTSGEVVNIKAQRGVDQGCPLASPVFGIATARPADRALRAIQAKDPFPVCRRHPVPPRPEPPPGSLRVCRC